jgi:hypothetical protein
VGSFVLNINNIIGPAVLTLPSVLQASGWLTPLIILIVMQIISALSSSMIAEAMQRVPGNQHFLRRIEFGTVMRHYFGRGGAIAGQIVLNICLQASNIASIVVAAQVLDDFFVTSFKHSYAFDFAHFEFLKSDGSATDANPFTGHIWVISLGYVVAMAICIPFGFLNLDDNMWFQWFSFFGMMLSFAQFFILFFLAGAGVIHEAPGVHVTPSPPPSNISLPLPPVSSLSPIDLHWDTHRVPLVSSSAVGQANVIGTIVFMSAFVTSIPSWVNEKKPKVSVNKSIWSSTLTSNILKLGFGYLAAITYANRSHNSNILNVISRHAPPGAFGVITRISVYLFNFATIIPGIPVLSILVRYNLVTGEICPPWVANLIGVVAPWVISMFFYHGKGLSIIVNWSAILFQGFMNFVIPGLLYYFALRRYPNFPEVVMERDEAEPTIKGINDSDPSAPETPMARTVEAPSPSPVSPPPSLYPVVDDTSETVDSLEGTDGSASIRSSTEQLLDGSSGEEKPAIDLEPSCCEEQTCEDPELAAPTTPGWFFANQGKKLRPVDALPRSLPLSWKKATAIGAAALMTAMSLAALIMDFYFLAKHQDIVDN